MSDWFGIIFFVLFAAGAFLGLKIIADRPQRTVEDFENRSADGTGILSAGVSGINELLNPNEAKAKEVIVQMKEGRFNKKKQEGKGNGESKQ